MTLCFTLLASGLALAHAAIGPGLALLGLAAAIKYSGLLLAIPLAAAAVVIGLRARRIGPLLAGAGAAGLVAAPWYLSNWTRVGNPVYPLLPRLFGGPVEAADRLLNWSASSRQSWAAYALRPDSLDADLGGGLLLLAFVGALFYAAATRRHLGIVAVVLSGFGLLLPFAPSARILLPAAAGACLLVGFAADAWRREAGARWPFALVALTSVRGAVLVAAHNAFFFNPVPCAVGIEKQEDYRARNFPPAPLFERADARLPAGARVLACGESRLFRFPRPTTAPSQADPPALRPFVRSARPEEALALLRGGGVTHLLVSLDALRPAKDAGASPLGLSSVERATLSWLVEHGQTLDRQGGLLLLGLPPG